MIQLVVWGLIIGLIIVWRDRIFGGLAVSLIFIGAVFFSIFMLDTFTMFDTRKFVPIMFYDTAVADPSGVAKNVKEKVEDKGKNVVGGINNAGKDMDGKYGTGLDKDDEENSVEEELTSKKEKAKKKEEKAQKKKPKSEQPSKQKVESGGSEFVAYIDIEEAIRLKYGDMTERDKVLALSLVPMMVISYEGDNYKVWNKRGEDGIYIARLNR